MLTGNVGIPVKLFEDATKHINLPKDLADFKSKIEIRLSLQELQTRSLIKINTHDQTIWIHRLLKSTLLQQMGSQRRQLCFDTVLRLLAYCFPTRTELSQIRDLDMNIVWTQCGLYLSHVVALVKSYNDWRGELHPAFKLAELLDGCTWSELYSFPFSTSDLPPYANLYNIRYLVDYGVYSTALRLFDTARDISELHPDENVVTRANLYNTYGTLFRNSSRSQEAVDLFRKAIQATERAVELNLMEADDSSASLCYMHIACAELQLGHLEESEKWHKKAISIREASVKSKPLELAMVYLNYGWCLWQQMKLDEASETLEKALSLMQNAREGSGSGSYGR